MKIKWEIQDACRKDCYMPDYIYGAAWQHGRVVKVLGSKSGGPWFATRCWHCAVMFVSLLRQGAHHARLSPPRIKWVPARQMDASAALEM